MKILYAPNLIVPSLDEGARAQILEAAGPSATLVEAKDAGRQRAEIVDADVLLGRVPNEIFVLNRRLRYYLRTHPRVIVTPHTAEGSPRRAGRAIATFCENLRRLRTGQPLLALIDKWKGY